MTRSSWSGGNVRGGSIESKKSAFIVN